MKNSEQCSGTRSRGTLPRGTRTTFHALCSNRIRLCGPLYTRKDKSAKSYVLLTCATTRAFYLELSSDMSVDKFRMALDRFVSRRGLPPHCLLRCHYIPSSPSRTDRDVTNFNDPQTCHYFAHRGITWKFIAPRAARWRR